MNVVAFNGSGRKDGNTAILIRHVFQELEAEGIETELFQLAGRPIHGCRACYKCWEKKDGRCSFDDDVFNECLEKMVAADGIILGSPTYFGDLTPETKALMDRAGFVSKGSGDLLKYKVGSAIAVARRAGTTYVLDSINHFFLISQMIVPGASYWNLGIGRDKGDVEKDEEGLRTMKVLGQNMAWLLKKIHG